MVREYASFLLRCWRLDGGEQRIRVEHTQSGEAMLAPTLEEAIGWLAARWDASPGTRAANGNSGEDTGGRLEEGGADR
ncbi:MAG TPA: hypothetical protein VFW96_11980 [Thermomicrobiales bacterium]|nr:hypothetical protein [Thermomicrobiales bacterium]